MATFTGSMPALLVGDTPQASTDWQPMVNLLTAQAAARTSYSPVWTTDGTAPAIGNGSLTGRYLQVNKFVYVKVLWQAGSTTTFGTGIYHFSLPVTPLVDQPLPTLLNDSSAAASFAGQTWISTSAATGDNMRIVFATDAGFQNLTNASPVTLATGDKIIIEGWYETT